MGASWKGAEAAVTAVAVVAGKAWAGVGVAGAEAEAATVAAGRAVARESEVTRLRLWTMWAMRKGRS